jgi:small subunit ribosomal protein S4
LARPTGPRFKVARHLGVNVFNHPKALKRGVNNSKLSDYGKQLLEKQKLKAYYGLLEKQFRKYVLDALKSKDNSGDVLILNLERRLDNLVYRLGFGSTLRQSRQMVVHGHILVNGKKVDRPSYKIEINDIISLRESSKKNQMFIENFEMPLLNLQYLEKNIEHLSGRLIRIPKRDEVPIQLADTRVIEFYSKN